MHDIYIFLGMVISYCAVIAGMSAVLATPFLFIPKAWDMTIGNFKFVKCTILVVATIIALFTVTVTIK